jgi:tetratricopeptide (TPR) repeat protein
MFSFKAFSQDKQLIDSLETQLIKHNASKTELKLKSPSLYDTAAANIIYSLSSAYWGNNPDKAIEYANQCLNLSEQIGYKKGMANAYNSLGAVNQMTGNYSAALDLHKKALKIREDIGDKQGIASSYNNMGGIFHIQGNHPEALRNHFAALKIREEMGDKIGISGSYNNIGVIYFNQRNYDEALKNHFASLKIVEESGDKKGIANSYSNIGIIYNKQGKYDEALKYYFAAFKIHEEIGFREGIARGYNNIGLSYYKQEKYAEALQNYFSALKINEEIGDKNGLALSYGHIAQTYSIQKKYKEAYQFLNKSFSLSKQIGRLEWIRDGYGTMAELDSSMGNFKAAFEHHKLYISYRDSIVNRENTKKITQQQMQFDFGKKQVADSLKFAQEKEIGELKLQKQKVFSYGGFFGVAVTILLLFFVYRNYNKQLIANQKLKEAQEQLIKSEKLAAFGIMAARVSHEMLNPLNFVNNFSELSQEMVTDVISATNETDKKQNADLLIANLKKINEHGKRASTIINQLQEHSRKGSAHEFFESNFKKGG